MKLYQMDSISRAKSTEILTLLREALKQKFPNLESDVVVSMPYEGEDQFFYKKKGELLWVRVFYDTLSPKHFMLLDQEFKRLSNAFKFILRPYIFFTSREAGCEVFKDFPGRPHFFEYTILHSGTEKAIGLKEWFVSPFSTLASLRKTTTNYRFYDHAQIDRKALGEIMELSLVLKRLSEAHMA